ncbi:alpha/beta fold hydrolase [Streptomyces iconiensis]|uniref:Alpha/beta hydrolase n=1 Tax=Streptomyces iconiensis TaxID=1384038 RepID=A0ABT7A739_9ACTN|nr:alpha/beta hydrolase [Streptomyces iconiensis]MDJ1137121.1 alpha/beta hydrolase [Streptomyces iconiensis]
MTTRTTSEGGRPRGGRGRAERATGALLNAVGALAPAPAGDLTFLLFRRPLLRGKVLPAEQAVHDRAGRDELLVDGERVVTYRWGDGERPVLMLHGWRSRASRFAAFVPRLEALGLSPVSFDAPGHGDSGGSATTILRNVEVARRLQDRYGAFHSVLAHSFGVTCAYLALREGVRAERLVAVSGVSHFGFLVEEFGRRLALTPRLGDGLRTRVEERLFPEVDDLWSRFDGTWRPAEIGVPTLLIHDEDDPTVPLRQAHRLRTAHAPHAELTVTTGLGHRRILAAPAVLAGALGFLQGTGEADSRPAPPRSDPGPASGALPRAGVGSGSGPGPGPGVGSGSGVG